MNFEAYLLSKKIDSVAFCAAEGSLWNAWQTEFDQLHPLSFTAQKLYLLNPIRRKYPLKETSSPVGRQVPSSISHVPESGKEAVHRPKPIMKPKPKIS